MKKFLSIILATSMLFSVTVCPTYAVIDLESNYIGGEVEKGSGDSYFSIDYIGNNTYRLADRGGRVYNFLIVGEKKALLIDTGYGHEALYSKVREITDKPLIVANTHAHSDHAAGDYAFDKVYVNDADIPAEGELLTYENLIYHILVGFFSLFPNFISEKIIDAVMKMVCIDFGDCQLEPLPEEIDLGGRVIYTVLCPGHTPGSTIFLDPSARCIYTGDTITENLWFFTDPNARISEYAARLDEISLLEGYDLLWPSHSATPLDFSFIAEYSEFVKGIDCDMTIGINVPGVKDRLCVYMNKGHCILLFKQQDDI